MRIRSFGKKGNVRNGEINKLQSSMGTVIVTLVCATFFFSITPLMGEADSGNMSAKQSVIDIAKVIRAYGIFEYGQLHYRIARPDNSSKTPILALHKSPSSGRIYAQLLSHIGTDRVAIAPDTPGFGESDVPPKPLEIADFAKANFELLDQLGIREPVDVIGYHTGSLTASEMALQQPNRIRHLVLISAPIYTEEELVDRRAKYAKQELREDGSHLIDIWNSLRYWADSKETLEGTMANFAEHLRGGETTWWGHRAAFNYDLKAVLPKLPHRILVLNPDDDLHEKTFRAAPLMQTGQIRELSGWSHGFLDIHTEETWEILRDFLDGG